MITCGLTASLYRGSQQADTRTCLVPLVSKQLTVVCPSCCLPAASGQRVCTGSCACTSGLQACAHQRCQLACRRGCQGQGRRSVERCQGSRANHGSKVRHGRDTRDMCLPGYGLHYRSCMMARFVVQLMVVMAPSEHAYVGTPHQMYRVQSLGIAASWAMCLYRHMAGGRRLCVCRFLGRRVAPPFDVLCCCVSC